MHFSLRFQRLRDSGADFRHFRYRFQRLRDSGTDFEHFRYRFQRLRDSGADLDQKVWKSYKNLKKKTRKVYTFFYPSRAKLSPKKCRTK